MADKKRKVEWRKPIYNVTLITPSGPVLCRWRTPAERREYDLYRKLDQLQGTNAIVAGVGS